MQKLSTIKINCFMKGFQFRSPVPSWVVLRYFVIPVVKEEKVCCKDEDECDDALGAVVQADVHLAQHVTEHLAADALGLNVIQVLDRCSLQ